MKWDKTLEWTGFAAGIVLALFLWSNVHSANHRETAQIPAIVSVETTDSADSEYSGKPSNRRNPESATFTANDTPTNDTPANDTPVGNTEASPTMAQPHISVRVYLTQERRIETVPLETYVRGVVAAEMPPDFKPAALEAQALAARTYIVRRLLEHDESGVPLAGADVTDTQTHQVYRALAEMNRLRRDQEQAWRKADDAARTTKGKIITYEGRPIQALYFSASNGYTENSEEVFPGALPYLRSVASPWDQQQQTPSAADTTEMPIREFYSKLGVRTIPTVARLGLSPTIKVTEWTEGKRIKKLAIGGKTFTGQQLRDLLKLRSASISWTVKGGKIILTTHGNGHGVGMSQWGAQGMAQAGNTAQQIVKHYYSGTAIMEVSKLASAIAQP